MACKPKERRNVNGADSFYMALKQHLKLQNATHRGHLFVTNHEKYPERGIAFAGGGIEFSDIDCILK